MPAYHMQVAQDSRFASISAAYQALSCMITPCCLGFYMLWYLATHSVLVSSVVLVCLFVFPQRIPSCDRMTSGCWMAMSLRSPRPASHALITSTSYASHLPRMTSSETRPTVPSWSARWGPTSVRCKNTYKGAVIHNITPKTVHHSTPYFPPHGTHRDFSPLRHWITWSWILWNGLTGHGFWSVEWDLSQNWPRSFHSNLFNSEHGNPSISCKILSLIVSGVCCSECLVWSFFLSC